MLSNLFATDLLKLIFNGTPIAGIADNAAAPLTQLYWSLHTSDPGPGGSQSTGEVNYTGYTRYGADRGPAGFTIAGAVMNPTSVMEFPEMTGGTPQTATHMCIGTSASGAGKVLVRFALSPAVQLDVNTIPRIRPTTSLTAVTS